MVYKVLFVYSFANEKQSRLVFFLGILKYGQGIETVIKLIPRVRHL